MTPAQAPWTILDCTLRDGGYYTNWDFSSDLVRRYLRAMASLPVSTIEIGYRAQATDDYLGAYYYLPRYLLEWMRAEQPNAPAFGVMLNAKDCKPAHLPKLLGDCKGLVELVRLAVDPSKVDHALDLAEGIRALGFSVGLNLMYLSKDYPKADVLGRIRERQNLVNCVSLVDSFGGCYPQQVARDIRLAVETLDVPIGFHGHDNISLAFGCALAALEAGATVIDSTMTGMGRGAGNLRTEIIAGYHEATAGRTLDYFESTPSIDEFEAMKAKCGWGTRLPYVVAGLNNLPQAQVMDWLAQDRYSTAAIVDALHRTTRGPSERSVPQLEPLAKAPKRDDACLIVGGGPSVAAHAEAIEALCRDAQFPVIFSSLRHYGELRLADCARYLCLVGDEYLKAEPTTWTKSPLEAIVADSSGYVGLPSDSAHVMRLLRQVSAVPSQHGAEDGVLGRACPFGVAAAAATALGYRKFYLVGFDGYAQSAKGEMLSRETQGVLDELAKTEREAISLTPTAYRLQKASLYALLSDHA